MNEKEMILNILERIGYNLTDTVEFNEIGNYIEADIGKEYCLTIEFNENDEITDMYI